MAVIPRFHEHYQDVILEHDRRPRNYHAMEGGITAERENLFCGDRLTLYVRVEDGHVKDASFQGTACAISKASASLLTECVKGQPIAQVAALCAAVQGMVEAPPGAPVEDLGPLSSLAGIRQFPARVECASLAWGALSEILNAHSIEQKRVPSLRQPSARLPRQSRGGHFNR